MIFRNIETSRIYSRKFERISCKFRSNGFQIRRHDFSSKSRAHSRLLRGIECRMHSRRERSIPETHMMRMCTGFSFIGIFISLRADDFACTKNLNHISPDLLKRTFHFNVLEALYNASFIEISQ